MMEDESRRDADLLERMFVQDITVGNLHSPMVVWDALQALAWNTPPNLAVALRYAPAETDGFLMGDRQQSAIREEITTSVRQAFDHMLVNWHEADECILLCAVPFQPDKQQLTQRLDDWLEVTSLSVSLKLAMGVSSIVESPVLLTTAIRQARGAALAALRQNRRLCHSEDLDMESDRVPSPSAPAVEDVGLDREIAAVHRTLAALKGHESDTLEQRKREALYSLVQLLNKCREQGLPVDDELVGGTSLFHSLLKVNTPFKLSLWIEESGIAFLHRLSKLVAETPSHIVEKAIQYIVSHLHEDLSLESIAKQCSVSHYYLSHLFPKETGNTLTAFVRKSRMDKALWLLGSTDQSIADIAYQVGFQDPNYFSKTFRAYVGQSPSEFRRSL